MTRNEYKKFSWEKDLPRKKSKIKKNRINEPDELKDPIKYGMFTKHHPDEPKFRHEQTQNNIKPYKRCS